MAKRAETPPAKLREVGGFALSLERAKRPITKALDDGLDAHNIEAAGPYKFSEFVVTVRDKAGALQGGFWTKVYYESAFLQAAWIDKPARRARLGRELMALTEAEAIRRGAKNIWLDTFSFQARPFYEKLGFAVYGTLKLGRPGVARYWMVKDLSGDTT